MRKKREVKPKPPEREELKQTDLAEGELDTVEESIRIHEQKGDLQVQTSGKAAASSARE
jgi:hypothetical protein